MNDLTGLFCSMNEVKIYCHGGYFSHSKPLINYHQNNEIFAVNCDKNWMAMT